MNITWTYEIINKSREDDHLITEIDLQFDGDIQDKVILSVYHFRPQTKNDVLAGIENRIITEKDRLVGYKTIDKIISEL
ncbi:MAG: hypothetical protein EBU90_16020 [Proteobacteria bacterium]|jgi:hypothetical protein|nr:hypothetical protein [Pseudomonadota bacterium]NBP15237.1 hypothetical protein [bacterium]